MQRSAFLARASIAQLAAGVVGMGLAIRRRHEYRFLTLHGDSAHVGREAIGMGTALSAPAPMLLTQAAATAWLLRTPSPMAERILGCLGVGMVVGYLGEELVRRRLRPSGWDPIETPTAVLGLVLAAGMAGAGLSARHDRLPGSSARAFPGISRRAHRGS